MIHSHGDEFKAFIRLARLPKTILMTRTPNQTPYCYAHSDEIYLAQFSQSVFERSNCLPFSRFSGGLTDGLDGLVGCFIMISERLLRQFMLTIH